MSEYYLFLDDERLPPDTDDLTPWMIARNEAQFFYIIETFGKPKRISFDHDLGENTSTGYDIAKKLVMKIFDGEMMKFPPDTEFAVHSMNPAGARSIKEFLDGNRRRWIAES